MAEESPPISPGSGRVSPALSSTSGSENEMDEDWNFVQLSAGGQVSAGGSETPMTNSSCEFVRVAGDGATYHRSDNASDTSDDNEGTQNNDDISASTAINDLDITPQVAETAPTVADNPGNMQQANQAALQTDQSTESVFVGGAAAGEPTKDEELRSLMEKLQEKVRSGSPCNSVSTDSDFVQLPQSSVERDELMDVSVSSSAGSRFNIIIQRDQQPFQHSDEEEEEAELLGQQRDRREGDPISDPDDRVESDILAARLVTEPRDDFPDNNDLIAEPVRHYRHSPNRDLNTLLTAIALTAIGFALGIAVGHSVGSAREAVLQQEIQEGQKLRLRSVQDDLLMCLRKQEDIDQTINKLNEIENILVDAEHWRNEYEELLNLKLANEEKWRQERGKLHITLAELERSHDRLMSSKSCAHDSEYLSRQESTLKSVHEKLEASLNDKDQQIINMQTELADHKINLRTAEEMANAYRKSNEDKSILILNLKEQLLELEREVFDLRVNSEIALSGGQQQNNNTKLSSATSEEVNMSKPGAERTQEVGTTSHPAENQEEDMQAAPVMTTGHTKTLDLLERDLITCHLKVEALQTQLDTAPVMQHIETPHAVENRATNQDHLSSPAADTTDDMDEASVEVDGPDDQPRFTSGPSDRESHNTVINNLQQQVARLQLQVQKHKLRQLKNTPHHLPDVSKNATDMPCVVLNVCDKLKVNITSAQLLRLYNASKQQYKSVEAFVFAEWKAISDEFRASLNGSTFAFDQAMWRQYLNETQSAFSSFLGDFNSTLEEIRNFSQTVLEPDTAQQKPGFQKKLQRKLSKVAKTVQKGFNHVKSGIVDKLGSLISDFTNDGQQENKRKGGGEKRKQDRNSKSDPKKHTKTTAEPVKEKQNSKQTRKFEKRLEKLRQDLYNMDSWRAQKMKRYEQENLYDRFEDFGDDYKYMFSNPDLGDVKSWVNCQSSWWKHHVYGGGELGDMTGCADQLMVWQMGSGLHQSSYRPSHDQADDTTEYESFEGYVDVDDYNPVIIEDIEEDYDDASYDAESADADGSWQFQRAEWRKYHRDEPDDWYWRRAHDHEHTPENNKHPTDIPFPKDEF